MADFIGRGSRLLAATMLAAVLAVLVALVAAPSVSASHVSPEFVSETANQTCGDLAETYSGIVGSVSWTELKVDPPASGVHSDGSFTVTISNLDGKSFDWTSDIGVDAVFVKAGAAGSYFYIYQPPAESKGDTGLTTPGAGVTNQISHIAFCYDVGDPGTTTTSTSTTTTSTSTTSTSTTSSSTSTSTSTSTTSTSTTSSSTSTSTSTSTTSTSTTSSSTSTSTSTSTTSTSTSTSTTTTSTIPDEVLPTSIVSLTTVPEVSPTETLPFTGANSGGPGLMAVGLLVLGLLSLVFARRSES